MSTPWWATELVKPKTRDLILFHTEAAAWTQERTHIGYYDAELDRFVSIDEGGEDTVNPVNVPVWMPLPTWPIDLMEVINE